MTIKYKKLLPNDKDFKIIELLNGVARKETFTANAIPKYQAIFKNKSAQEIDRFLMDFAKQNFPENFQELAKAGVIFENPIFPQFMPLILEDYLEKGDTAYIAYDFDKETGKSKLVGYSYWIYVDNYKEPCIATHLYVRPDYRRRKIGMQLIKVHLPNVSGILADQANHESKRMYEKYFPDKVVYGALTPKGDNKQWIPADDNQLMKQVYLFDKAVKRGLSIK